MKKKDKVPKAREGFLYIAGVGVDLLSKDIREAKSVEDLKKTQLFSHMSEAAQTQAYSELAQTLFSPPGNEEDNEENVNETTPGKPIKEF